MTKGVKSESLVTNGKQSTGSVKTNSIASIAMLISDGFFPLVYVNC